MVRHVLGIAYPRPKIAVVYPRWSEEWILDEDRVTRVLQQLNFQAMKKGIGVMFVMDAMDIPYIARNSTRPFRTSLVRPIEKSVTVVPGVLFTPRRADRHVYRKAIALLGVFSLYIADDDVDAANFVVEKVPIVVIPPSSRLGSRVPTLTNLFYRKARSSGVRCFVPVREVPGCESFDDPLTILQGSSKTRKTRKRSGQP